MAGGRRRAAGLRPPFPPKRPAGPIRRGVALFPGVLRPVFGEEHRLEPLVEERKHQQDDAREDEDRDAAYGGPLPQVVQKQFRQHEGEERQREEPQRLLPAPHAPQHLDRSGGHQSQRESGPEAVRRARRMQHAAECRGPDDRGQQVEVDGEPRRAGEGGVVACGDVGQQEGDDDGRKPRGDGRERRLAPAARQDEVAERRRARFDQVERAEALHREAAAQDAAGRCSEADGEEQHGLLQRVARQIIQKFPDDLGVADQQRGACQQGVDRRVAHGAGLPEERSAAVGDPRREAQRSGGEQHGERLAAAENVFGRSPADQLPGVQHGQQAQRGGAPVVDPAAGADVEPQQHDRLGGPAQQQRARLELDGNREGDEQHGHPRQQRAEQLRIVRAPACAQGRQRIRGGDRQGQQPVDLVYGIQQPDEVEPEAEVDESVEHDGDRQPCAGLAARRAERGDGRDGEEQVEERAEEEHVAQRRRVGSLRGGAAARGEERHDQPGRRKRDDGELPPPFAERQEEHAALQDGDVREEEEVAPLAARDEEGGDVAARQRHGRQFAPVADACGEGRQEHRDDQDREGCRLRKEPVVVERHGRGDEHRGEGASREQRPERAVSVAQPVCRRRQGRRDGISQRRADRLAQPAALDGVFDEESHSGDQHEDADLGEELFSDVFFEIALRPFPRGPHLRGGPCFRCSPHLRCCLRAVRPIRGDLSDRPRLGAGCRCGLRRFCGARLRGERLFLLGGRRDSAFGYAPCGGSGCGARRLSGRIRASGGRDGPVFRAPGGLCGLWGAGVRRVCGLRAECLLTEPVGYGADAAFEPVDADQDQNPEQCHEPCEKQDDEEECCRHIGGLWSFVRFVLCACPSGCGRRGRVWPSVPEHAAAARAAAPPTGIRRAAGRFPPFACGVPLREAFPPGRRMDAS